MQFSLLALHLPFALASLTYASPPRPPSNHTLSILIQTSSGLDPVHITIPLQVPLYHLTRCSLPPSHLCSASKLTIDPLSSPTNVDLNAVECRAYKDAEGMLPGSAAFTVGKPALLSTNLVDVGSMICYIIETD
ncbi:hypothetical protein L207DRAFT_631420 [Hyaloscypha variabilis F]|uniref:Uncharacterized protein n=1 Tax=Hyaloscypha variabilis (strain UAMH 11265 / GT02V1 / F) TaxID=1149755 RepID=A0A2J6RXQ8_HYAVF|nr:hypothetical protein L207DRAFT_631420 [Hyaloscypha variabilis F]